MFYLFWESINLTTVLQNKISSLSTEDYNCILSLLKTACLLSFRRKCYLLKTARMSFVFQNKMLSTEDSKNKFFFYFGIKSYLLKTTWVSFAFKIKCYPLMIVWVSFAFQIKCYPLKTAYKCLLFFRINAIFWQYESAVLQNKMVSTEDSTTVFCLSEYNATYWRYYEYI